MEQIHSFVEKHALKNRCGVSDDSDAIVSDIKDLIGGVVYEGQCDNEYLNWVIPPKWTVRKATLKDTNGRTIVDYKENPMRLWSYSSPFSGRIKRDELIPHLYFRKDHPALYSYHYGNQYKFESYKTGKWGFCITYNEYLGLNDDEYVVEIDSDFSMDSSMKVLDCFLPGKSEKTIMFAAHHCHPGQVNDGLAAIAVCLGIYKELQKIEDRTYSYRIVIGPEFFGAAVFLAHAKNINNIIAGMYFDDPACEAPLNLSLSFSENAMIDRVAKNVLKDRISNLNISGFQGIVGNDEHFYQDTEYNIPFISINRLSKDHHFDTDNLKNYKPDALKETIDLVMAMIEVYERDYVPCREYKGPLYQSRYGIEIDYRESRGLYDLVKYMHFHMDGKKSCFEIADCLGAPFGELHGILEQLYAKNLISKKKALIKDAS